MFLSKNTAPSGVRAKVQSSAQSLAVVGSVLAGSSFAVPETGTASAALVSSSLSTGEQTLQSSDLAFEVEVLRAPYDSTNVRSGSLDRLGSVQGISFSKEHGYQLCIWPAEPLIAEIERSVPDGFTWDAERGVLYRPLDSRKEGHLVLLPHHGGELFFQEIEGGKVRYPDSGFRFTEWQSSTGNSPTVQAVGTGSDLSLGLQDTNGVEAKRALILTQEGEVREVPTIDGYRVFSLDEVRNELAVGRAVNPQGKLSVVTLDLSNLNDLQLTDTGILATSYHRPMLKGRSVVTVREEVGSLNLSTVVWTPGSSTGGGEATYTLPQPGSSHSLGLSMVATHVEGQSVVGFVEYSDRGRQRKRQAFIHTFGKTTLIDSTEHPLIEIEKATCLKSGTLACTGRQLGGKNPGAEVALRITIREKD